jgi:hypothetical protein
LIGLIAIVASVDYAAATFLNVILGLYGVNFILNFGDDQSVPREVFVLFTIIVALHALINIYSSPLVAMFNNISVGWHVLGVAAIVAILVFVPDTHQSADFVFTETNNLNGFSDGMFWWYVLPVGFLLTMYTVTGYDASAHVSEETHGRGRVRAEGRLALRVLLGRDRLDRPARDHVRRDGHRGDRRGLRLLARDLRDRARARAGPRPCSSSPRSASSSAAWPASRAPRA